MQPQNHIPLFPTMASLPQSGRVAPMVFAPNTNVPNWHSLSPGMRRVLKIDTPASTDPDVAGKTSQLMKVLLAKNPAPVSFAPTSSTDSGVASPSRAIRHRMGLDKPHEPTLSAFKDLAALGTVPPSINDISTAALEQAGLHAATFFIAYSNALSHLPTTLAPVPGVDDAVRNVSALTGQACAEIMQYRYMPAQETDVPVAPSFTY